MVMTDRYTTELMIMNRVRSHLPSLIPHRLNTASIMIRCR